MLNEFSFVCFQCQCTNIGAQVVIVFRMRFFPSFVSLSLMFRPIKSLIVYKFPHHVSKQRANVL